MKKQFATFYIGDNLFGIDVLLVREINKNLDITPVDRAPELVHGLMNLRGQIVTVVDLAVRLGLGQATVSEETCCIVLKTQQELEKYRTEGFDLENTSDDIVGFLVDRIGDMLEVDDSVMEPPPANIGDIDGKYLSSVAKLDGNILIELKITEILAVETSA